MAQARWAWSKGRRPSGAVLHSSREPDVRRPCSDVVDMLRRLKNCRIIIIIIIIIKVGTDKLKLKVKMQSVSDDDARKRLLEKPRFELPAKGVFRLGRRYILRQGVPGFCLRPATGKARLPTVIA